MRGLGTGDLVSFVSVTASAARSGAVVRLVHSTQRGGRVGPGGHEDSALRYRSRPARRTTLYVAWLPVRPAPGRRSTQHTYEAARDRLVEFWNARLGEAVKYDVPEAVVMNAQRSLLEQDLALTWRYSVGNPYEEFSFAESLDVAEVMGSYGFTNVMRQILRTSFRRLSTRAVELADGRADDRQRALLRADRRPRLPELGHAAHRRLHDGARAADAERPARPAAAGAVLVGHRRRVYGLHSQTAVWQGLNAIGAVWAATGQPGARRPRARGSRAGCGPGSSARSRRPSHRLKDGSLFVPAVLLAKHKPFDAVTALAARQLLEPGRCRTRSRPASSSRSGTQANADPALHARPRLAAARARARRRATRSTAERRATRSPAPTRSTGWRSRGSSPTTTSPTSSCSASTGCSARR